MLSGFLLFFGYFVLGGISPAVANTFMIYGIALVGLTIILEATVAHQKVPYEISPLFQKSIPYEQPKSAIVTTQNEPTPQARRLHEALKERGIFNKLEPFDGYKHVDISIPWAKLNIEIDGKYHLTFPEHLFRDLQRDACSHNDGIDTIRIPNLYVDSDLDGIANSIAVVARKRHEGGTPSRQTRYRRY
jgi:very-short-patch-repair endonuclease